MNKAILGMATVLLAAGCAPTRPVHYYTLAPVTPPAYQVSPSGPTVLVGLIATPESLQDSRIRYRAGANETGSYEYHRWEERPGAIVRLSLVRALRASGKYRRVMEASSSAVGDYLLRGRLYEFAEVDSPAVQTVISMHLELVDEKTGRTVWDHSFEHQEPASGKGMADVVASMQRNLQQIAAEAAVEVGRGAGL